MGYAFTYVPKSSSATCNPLNTTQQSSSKEKTPVLPGSNGANTKQDFSPRPLLDDPLASTRLAPESPSSSFSLAGILDHSTSNRHHTSATQKEYEAQFRFVISIATKANPVPILSIPIVPRFETIKKGSKRHIWVQRDMCRFHGDELMVASLSNVPTVCVDDRIEIPVNIANAFGLVDLNSIVWMPLEFIYEPYRQFGHHCELERPKQSWLVTALRHRVGITHFCNYSFFHIVYRLIALLSCCPKFLIIDSFYSTLQKSVRFDVL